MTPLHSPLSLDLLDGTHLVVVPPFRHITRLLALRAWDPRESPLSVCVASHRQESLASVVRRRRANPPEDCAPMPFLYSAWTDGVLDIHSLFFPVAEGCHEFQVAADPRWYPFPSARSLFEELGRCVSARAGELDLLAALTERNGGPRGGA